MESGKNKIIMVAILALLVILIITIVGVSIFVIGALKSKNPSAYSRSGAGLVTQLTPDQITPIPLTQPISTDLLTGQDGVKHVASATISVGVDNTDRKQSTKFLDMVKSQDLAMSDACLRIIRNKTYDELKQPNGEQLLANEILVKLQEMFQSNLIYTVYISQLYVE